MVEPGSSLLAAGLLPGLHHLGGGRGVAPQPPRPLSPGRRRSGGAPGVSLVFDTGSSDLGREFPRTSSLMMLRTLSSYSRVRLDVTHKWCQ